MNTSRQQRRRDRKKQLKINSQLKKRLFGHLSIAPCCYCRRVFLLDELTIEHMKPLTLGGSNEDHNIALACAPCNHLKGQEAWALKRRLVKRDRDEQHSSQHNREDRARTLQGKPSSHLHSQGNGVSILFRSSKDRNRYAIRIGRIQLRQVTGS